MAELRPPLFEKTCLECPRKRSSLTRVLNIFGIGLDWKCSGPDFISRLRVVVQDYVGKPPRDRANTNGDLITWGGKSGGPYWAAYGREEQAESHCTKDPIPLSKDELVDTCFRIETGQLAIYICRGTPRDLQRVRLGLGEDKNDPQSSEARLRRLRNVQDED